MHVTFAALSIRYTMMKRIPLWVAFGLITAAAWAQQKANDPVLLTVADQPVTRSEFEAIYKKNNKNAPVDKESLDEYLNLFIDYKLKVHAAMEAGMDTAAKFKNELKGYRAQLARPYLIDRNLNEQLIQEAFDRSKEEVRASHILVNLAEDASPQDTAAAWKRIMELRKRVIDGEDFAQVATSPGGSDDPSAKTNGGDLGFFTVLQMVYPFENAAYNTPVGEVSPPVRTKFGYHIIKVTDRRPQQGEMTAAHIMIRSVKDDSQEKQQAAEARIREAYDRIKSGELTFEQAALKYSDDNATNTKGGELPPFTTGKMIPEFEAKAFALKTDGAISEPFRTPYGWHIVKRIGHTPPPPFEEAKGDLKARIMRDSRSAITKDKFLDDLRKQYKYKAYPKNLNAVEKALDQTVFLKGTMVKDTLLRKDAEAEKVSRSDGEYARVIEGTLKNGHLIAPHGSQHGELTPAPDDTVVVRDTHLGWRLSAASKAKLNKPVLTIDRDNTTQADFLEWIEQRQRRGPAQPLAEFVKAQFDKFADEELLAYEDARLEEKHPEFRMLMQEYHDGILLFELTDQMVWSKAVRDTAGLEAFYQQHKNEYMYPVRYEATIYRCADEKTAKKARANWKKGKRGEALAATLNNGKDKPLVEVETGLFAKEDRPIIADVEAGLTPEKKIDGKVVFAEVDKVVQPTPKPLDEVRGSITAAYQDQLEKEWLNELRSKYPVQVNKDILYSIR